MRNKKKLLVEQLDTKLEPFFSTTGIVIPPRGWINAVRTAINMTMAQLGSKLDITKQGVKGIEDSEAAGTISLKTLNEAAEALGAIGDRAAIDTLRQYRDDPEPVISESCEVAIDLLEWVESKRLNLDD